MNADPELVAATTALAGARAFIAREVLDAHRAPLTLGEITLHPHQRRAVARLSSLVARHGGALLADPTGLGKTYVALAAARDVEHVLIICPAALRDSWRRACARVRRSAPVLSLEQLSRGVPDVDEACELVIIDESHHLRNPRTKRYHTVASLCDRKRVLLLSATPVQNRRDDLVAQLALFLGDPAYAMADLELSRVVVRREVEESSSPLPALVGPTWLTLPAEDDILEDIVALPPAVPLEDEGHADALLRYTLLRQWSSSRAALVAGLRGRLARGVALIAALEAGRRPTRQELAAWAYVGDAVQLALPELVVRSSSGERSFLDAVERHVGGVRALLDRLRRTRDPDPDRAEVLREVRQRHPDRRIIIFSQYAETVRVISRLLMMRDAGIAELTARGGRVAGGRVTRDEVLAQFSPAAPAAATAERISLLVTTDVSSEGLDLQRASVVVHLDLPWNPARLEQRVGRVRRLGGSHERVFVYALAPPAPAERVLEVESRLRAKLRIAARLVGIGTGALPTIELDSDSAPTSSMSELLSLLERWRSDAPAGDARRGTTPACSGVVSSAAGYLALIADGDERLLIADIGTGPTLDPRVVGRAALLANGEATLPHRDAIAAAHDSISKWWVGRITREAICRFSAEGTRIRAKLAARIDATLAGTPRHARTSVASIASAARQTLRVPLGIGAERRLADLAEWAGDARWLGELAALGVGRTAVASHREAGTLAVIVFVPAEPNGEARAVVSARAPRGGGRTPRSSEARHR